MKLQVSNPEKPSSSFFAFEDANVIITRESQRFLTAEHARLGEASRSRAETAEKKTMNNLCVLCGLCGEFLRLKR
jgi:hypothetical protein